MNSFQKFLQRLFSEIGLQSEFLQGFLPHNLHTNSSRDYSWNFSSDSLSHLPGSYKDPPINPGNLSLIRTEIYPIPQRFIQEFLLRLLPGFFKENPFRDSSRNAPSNFFGKFSKKCSRKISTWVPLKIVPEISLEKDSYKNLS